MPIAPPLDGPPPSPAVDPAAAQETGASPGQVQSLLGGQNPAFPSGPDLSGVLTLGQKIDAALTTLAQAVPLISPEIQQMQAILTNALGKFSATSTGSGTSGQMPMGMVVSPTGNQFPGAMNAGKPF